MYKEHFLKMCKMKISDGGKISKRALRGKKKKTVLSWQDQPFW